MTETQVLALPAYRRSPARLTYTQQHESVTLS